MWELDDLNQTDMPRAYIHGRWCAARPLNYTKSCLSMKQRILRAWKVFKCEADAFMWPEGQ